jgi:hypothetical protein
VAGRYWLARALETCGDAAGARRAREEGWREYTALPRFRRRQERPFAWRLRPSRPALVAVAVVVGLALVLRGVVLPALSETRRPPAEESP